MNYTGMTVLILLVSTTEVPLGVAADLKKADQKKLGSSPKPVVPIVQKKEKEQRSVNAWVLNQRHDFLGSYLVYACAVGVRAENLNNGLVCIASPPEWTVVTLAPESKQYNVCKLQELRSPLSIAVTIFTGKDLVGVPVSLVSHSTSFGQPSVIYKSTKAFEDRQTADYASQQIHPTAPKNATYQLALLDVPAKECEFVQRIYGIPRVPGMPVELRYSKVKSGENLLLSTQSCRYQSVSPTLFSLPAHYKKTDSSEFLRAQSPSGKAGIGLIIHELNNKQGFSNLNDK